MKSFSFNGNKSRIMMGWSPSKQAYLVWREDDTGQSGARIFSNSEKAEGNFQSRVRAVK